MHLNPAVNLREQECRSNYSCTAAVSHLVTQEDILENTQADICAMARSYSVKQVYVPVSSAMLRNTDCDERMQAGVDWSAMQLFNRLEEIAHALPPSSQALHHAELQQRHHAIDYSITGTVASVCESMHSLPQHQWGVMQLSNDRILVCYGGFAKQQGALCIPYFVTQAEYVNQYLSTAPAYSIPDISKIVYPVSMQRSSLRRNLDSAYLSNGTWVQAAADGFARLVSTSSELKFFTSGNPQVFLHGKYGLHAAFFMHTPEKAIKAKIESEAKKQEAVANPQIVAGARSENTASAGKVRFHI
jgi:hypothetical protein